MWLTSSYHEMTIILESIKGGASIKYTVTEFFDENVDKYSNHELYAHHLKIIDLLDKYSGINKKLLDIGGGSGVFCKEAIKRIKNLSITVVDPSRSMLEKINHKDIRIVLGALPDKLNINISEKYDYILLDTVLHHLVGKSVNESKRIATQSICYIRNLLADDGFLIVVEIYYEGYILRTSSRNIIFYILLLQNVLHIQIPNERFIKGLLVCFYTRDELISIFRENGYELISSQEYPWGKSKIINFFIKNYGEILYILKKSY